MLRRLLLRSLVLAGILLACFAHLIWNGWHAKKIVAENLPHPALSTGKREIDLWHPTASPGHVYDFTWAWPEDKPWKVPEGSRLEVQLASGGRTRLLVVLLGHPSESPTWWDVLRCRHRLQIVGDREWVNLGPLPAEGTKLEMQVYGLLPGPFAFAEPNAAGTGHFNAFFIRRPDSPRARPSRTIVRYRFRVADPVPAGEMLTRFFFFISCSRVLQVTGIAALALLFAGWFCLWEGWTARAVACLVPAATLMHVCCLAPLQGADEATHVGTVEATLFNPELFRSPLAYPRSIALLYEGIGYPEWAGQPEVPVTAILSENRLVARQLLSQTLGYEATQDAGIRRDAILNNPRSRAPFYYNAFRIAGPFLRSLALIDRVEAYVASSAAASLACFLAGLALITRGRNRAPLISAYGLLALWPYSIGVVASCSNYSLAIGIGQFLAACLVTGVLAEDTRARLRCAALFTLVSVVAIGVWDDFVFVAVPALCITASLAVMSAWQSREGNRRTVLVLAATLIGGFAAVTFVYSIATGRIRQLVSSIGARLPKELGGFEDPSLWLLLALAAAPLVVSLVLMLSVLRARDWPASTREHAAWTRSAALAFLFLVLFAVTPWTSIPFETTRLDFPDEVATHWRAFWSNNFAFDQDILSWQMYWGVFGYADVSYPTFIYAIARWACVGILIALPVLSWRSTDADRNRSAAMLSLSAFALSVCLLSNSIRFLMPSNPWGRFILPLLPLVALPLAARMLEVPRRRLTIALLSAFVALHTWTAITLLASRYSIGTT